MNLSKMIALASRDGFRELQLNATAQGLTLVCRRDQGPAEATALPGKKFEPAFIEELFSSIEGLQAVGWQVEIATDAVYFARNQNACGRLGTLDVSAAERKAA